MPIFAVRKTGAKVINIHKTAQKDKANLYKTHVFMVSKKLRFAIIGNTYQRKKSAAIEQILNKLHAIDAEVYIDADFYTFLTISRGLDINAAKVFRNNDFDADFVVSMGGDGTFLKAASCVGSKEIPIIGVNMGRLGFLADVSPDEFGVCIDAILKGEYHVDNRKVMQVDTDNEPLNVPNFGLNDVSILKRDSASMITIHAYVDDQYLATYQADGLVVSTPTGSTAYSLSNGGPIIIPGTYVFSMTAVAPHSLNFRPIVIPDCTVIKLKVESRSHNFLVAVDGQSAKCSEGTTLTIRKASYGVKVVKYGNKDYFSTLREKMMWGVDSRG